jgi:predicted amidophosphoribosyltransferase
LSRGHATADTPESGPVEREISRCPNCSAELEFEYCVKCGQRRIHPQDLSARRYVRQLADEVSTFRERFKTLRTLRKLLIPGFLSAEFLAGRRQPYLTPFKVYVVCRGDQNDLALV